jgi:probable rRNA maturation factor
MLASLELGAVELSVALVDDLVMRELNRNWRGIDRATDVLAFAMREGEALHALDVEPIGDVILSIPTAQRQARRSGRSLLGEITMLLAHGLLHLLGYDHRTAAEGKVMRTKTAALEALFISRRAQ